MLFAAAIFVIQRHQRRAGRDVEKPDAVSRTTLPYYTVCQISAQYLFWHTIKCGSMDSFSVNSIQTTKTVTAPLPGTDNTQHYQLLVFYSDPKTAIYQKIFKISFSFYSSTFITVWKI